MRPRRRLCLVMALLSTVLVGTACSSPVDSGPKAIRTASIPEGLRMETSSTTTTTVPTGDSEEVTVFLIGPPPEERLIPVKRRVRSPITVEKILQKLFTPPTTAEGVAGFRTAISPDTTVLGVQIENKILTVDVSKVFAFGDVPDQIRAYAQVVFTAVETGSVTGVQFAVNGRRLEVPAGDGSNQTTPVGRGSYQEYAPR